MENKFKRFLSLVVALVMVFGMFPMNVFATEAETTESASWYDETATELVIDSVEDLLEFAALTVGGNKFAGKTIKLDADIDLAGTCWYHRDAEGNVLANYRITDFAGTFDGQNHTISNVRLLNEYDSGSSVGLCFFRSVTGTVKNLTLDGVDADSVGNATFYVMNSVATSNSAKPAEANLVNVHLKNADVYIDNDETAAGTYSQVAGMIRWAGKGTYAEGCSVSDLNATVTGNAAAGGFSVFVAQTTELYNCDVTDVTLNVGSVEYGIGGFAGQVQSSSYVQRIFRNCSVSNLDMTIGYLDAMAGGFLGNLGGMVDCDNCTASGKITVKSDVANAHVGGFTGDLGWQGDWSSDEKGHTFDNCSANVDITAVNSDVGGFVGMSAIVDDTVLDQDEAFAAVFTNCSASGDVYTVNGAAGAFVGSGDRGEYRSCVASGKAEGAIAGGFWGEVFSMPAAPANGNTGKGDAFTGIVITDCTNSAEYYGETEGALIGVLDVVDDETTYTTPTTIENNHVTEKKPPVAYVAEVNGEQFETLSEAVAAANELGVATVKLLKNVTLGEKLTISGNVTIEGEYTITRDDAYTGTFFTVNAGASLTLDGNLTIDGGNNYAFNKEAYEADLANWNTPTANVDRSKWFTPEEGAPVATAYMITTTGTVNLYDVTIRNNYSDGCGIISAGKGAVVTLEGAQITHNANTNGSGLVVNASTNVYSREEELITVTMNEGTLIDGNHVGGNHGIFKIYMGTYFTMNGGEVKNTTGWNSNGTVVGVYHGVFIMNGGTICSNSSVYGPSNGRNAAIYGHSNHLFVMNGGTICHNTGRSKAGIDSPYAEVGYTGETYIKDGTVVYNEVIGPWTEPDVSGGGTLAITGGWYSQDVTKYCAEGYTVIKEYNEDLEQELYHVVDYIAWVKAQLLAGKDVKLIQDIKIDDYSYVNALKLPSNRNGKYDERHGNGAVFHVTKPGVVLDLNGYDIIWDAHDEDYCNARQVSLFMVTATGIEGETAELNIVDSIGDSKVEVYGMASGLYSVCVGAKGTIEGGTWTNYPCNDCGASNIFLYPSHGGELYITGGTFEQKASEYLLGWNGSSEETTNNGVGTDQDESLFSITGGTFVGQNPELTKFFDTAYGGKESTINAVAEGYKAIEVEENVWVVNPFVTVTVTVNDVTYVEGNPVPTEFSYTTDVACPELNITYTVDGDVINATVAEMEGYKFDVVPGKLVKEKALVRVDVSNPKSQKFFVSLQEALDFAAAQTVSCNVFILDNITITEPIVYTDTKADNVELQSIKTGKNTYTVTSTCDEALFTVNGGRFAVKNLNINAKGDAFYVNSGTLTLQGAYQGKQELYVTSETGNCVYVRGGSVSIRSNVYLTANGEYPAIQGNGNYVGNVSFGDWIASDPGVPQVSAPNSDMAIYWPGNGNLTIDYGVFTGDTAVYAKSGKITINGGEFYGTGEKKDFVHSSNGASATGDALVIENCKDAAYETPVVSITGGTFVSENAKSVAVYNCNESTKVEKFISGGFFNVEPDAELPIEGYGAKRYSRSLWTVGPMTGTITVDGVWYADWEAAESAITNNSVIKLYADQTNTKGTSAFNRKDEITLDLNGFTLSSPYEKTSVNSMPVEHTDLYVVDSFGGGKLIGNDSHSLFAYINGNVYFDDGVQFIGSLQSTNGKGKFYVDGVELLGANGIFQTTGTARIKMHENGDWTVSIGTLTMTADYALADNTLTINKGYSINLNGNDLTAKNISVFGNLIDTADGEGFVKVTEKLWFNGHNNGGYLPLKDEAVGGYRLFATELVNKGGREQTTTHVKFGFTVKLNLAKAYELLAEAAQQGMLSANASWTAAGETEEKGFEYSEDALRNHANAALAQLNAGKAVTSTMVLNIYDETALTSGDQVTGNAKLSTDTGVIIESETVNYTKE